jgi:hypothetical protein
MVTHGHFFYKVKVIGTCSYRVSLWNGTLIFRQYLNWNLSDIMQTNNRLIHFRQSSLEVILKGKGHSKAYTLLMKIYYKAIQSTSNGEKVRGKTELQNWFKNWKRRVALKHLFMMETVVNWWRWIPSIQNML